MESNQVPSCFHTMSSQASISKDSLPAPDLGLEDFRRLGVRPLECRQTVIRLAALRSSRALAKQQLSTPSDQGSRQLSSLMTSAYRLLDPRRRADPLQRALIGRILPHALSVAGQTNFVSDYLPVDQEVPDVPALGGEDGPLIDIAVQTEAPPQWTITLGEQDLLGRRPSRLRFGPTGSGRTFQRASYAAVALVIAGVMVGATIGTSSVGDYLEQLKSHWPTVANANTRPAELDNQTTPTTGSLPDDQARSASQASNTPDQRADTAPSVPDPLEAIVKAIDSVAIDSDAVDDDAGNRRSDEAVAQPESLALSVRPVAVDQPAIGQPEPPSEADLQPIQSPRNPIPAEQDLSAARRKLMAEIPRLSESIDIQALGQRIDLMLDYADQQPLGSAEHWNAMITLAQHYWLVDDILHVRGQVEFMAENYLTSAAGILASSFVESCSLARLPETHEHLLANGLRLCDWLLVAEAPAECQQVVDILSQIDQRPEPTEVNRRLKEFSDAIEQTKQLGTATERWIQQSDKSVASEDTGVAGRYYCLLLRQWDPGLDWLAEASDTRIARIARQELAAQDADSRFDVAVRWLELARLCNGRTANSMRLHAIEMLRAVQTDSSAIKQLQIGRTIDETMQALPADLRSVAYSRQSS